MTDVITVGTVASRHRNSRPTASKN